MKHLVLLGAGHAHVHVLSRLAQAARKAPLPFKLSLIAPYPRQMYSGMLPGHLAGHYSLAQCTIDLTRLINDSGATYIPGKGMHIDAAKRIVSVATPDSSFTVPYDILSVNTGPVMDRQRIEQSLPGAREHALFLRPIESFSSLWEKVLQMSSDKPLRIAVIGGGAAGAELAMAIRHRLPHCGVTLVCGSIGPVGNYPQPVRERVIGALKARSVTLLPQNCTAIGADHITLDQVTQLMCDVPILALGAQAPRWLGDSGLALDDEGFLAVNAYQQSTSHHEVFAAGDVSSRTDWPHPRSGVYAIRSAPTLATNLLAAVTAGHMVKHAPPARTLNLLACGNRYAVASRGAWSAQGRLMWYWKDWIDRRFMARYGTR